MNQRIRDLMEQAGEYARNHVAECKLYRYYMEHDEYEQRFQEKFSELIVQELLKTCEEHPAWTGRMIGEQIRQHFGVEE